MKNNKFLYESNPGTALITGSAGGLGLSFAQKLASEKYDLILVDKRKEPLMKVSQSLQKEFQITTTPIVADLSEKDEVALVETQISENKNLTMLINNAGFAIADGYLATTDIERQIEMIRVHNIAVTRFTVAALTGMTERNRGDIINVASILAYIPLMANALYCATKAFLVKFTETLHLEVYNTGLRVQVLLPGFIRTGFHDSMGVDMSTGKWDKYPWMDPEEIVEESIKALLKGKVIYIPGKNTRNFVRKVKIVPRKLMYKMLIKQAKKLEEEKKVLEKNG